MAPSATGDAGPTDTAAPAGGAAPPRDPSRGDRARLLGLDGLRGVAASLIVVHHAANVAGADRSAPFTQVAAVADVGVAVFFVLSGFVIYRPFAAAHAGGGPVPEAVPFWWRRALRVLPAYWFALVGLWALGLNSFNSVGEFAAQASLTHVFAPGLAFQGISQSWSLSVELSFYAIVPLISWALRRRRGPVSNRREWAMVAGLFAAGYAVRFVLSLGEVTWGDSTLRGMSFLWLPTNIDLFAIGMALAVFHARNFVGDGLAETLRPRAAAVVGRLHRAGRAVGPWWLVAAALLALYAYAVGPADFDTGYTGWFWARRQLTYGLIGLALVFPLSRRGGSGVTRRVLASTAGVWFGAFSYGLYLWHNSWIERVGTELTDPTPGLPAILGTGPGNVWFPATLAVGFGLGLICGAIGWFVVEEPLQRFRSPRWLRAVRRRG
ncbi:MAG: acyltransferase [Microthrixaceae bacterium]|nr:acyltransferase [Microthrixaceae bacterium]